VAPLVPGTVVLVLPAPGTALLVLPAPGTALLVLPAPGTALLVLPVPGTAVLVSVASPQFTAPEVSFAACDAVLCEIALTMARRM
jgi:hypothetical protein